MDPITHAAGARIAASIGRPPLPRATAVLSVVAGLAPDLDAILMPVGWDVYLRVHEAGTHSLAGGALLAIGLARLFRAFAFVSGPGLLPTALIAVFTHILLDAISGATIRLGWPFVGGRTAVGLVGMADPWVAAPIGIAIVWAVAARRPLDRVAWPTVLVLSVVCAVKIASRVVASREFDRGQHAATAARGVRTHRALHAQWGSLARWWVYERADQRACLWSVDSWSGSVTLVLDRPLAGHSDMLAREGELVPVRNFLLAHDLPIRVAVHGAHATTVFWSDLRFCFAPDPKRDPARTRLAPTTEPVACGVWFGGEIDAGGSILRQFVTIGGWVQER